MIKRIAIVGPESTGKSQLAQQLAAQYETVWVEEFARYYVENLDRPYTEEDLQVIAAGQLTEEDKAAQNANSLLFCDTNLIVVKVWSEYKYQRCHPWILNNMQLDKYALHLLTAPDIGWEPDPLREHPDKREELFEIYERELDEANVSYRVVYGHDELRMKVAMNYVEEMLVSLETP